MIIDCFGINTVNSNNGHNNDRINNESTKFTNYFIICPQFLIFATNITIKINVYKRIKRFYLDNILINIAFAIYLECSENLAI